MTGIVLVALPACTFLTSVDGLSGGDLAPVADASSPKTEAGEAAAPLDAADANDTSTAPDGADPRADAYAKAVLADTPIAYWRLEESALSTAKDEMKLHDAVYELAPSLGEPGIVGGRAVRLPAGQHARLTQGDLVFRFAGTAPYAVELWVKIANLGSYQWLAGTEAPNAPRSGWSLFINDTGGVGFEVWGAPLVDGGSTQRRGAYATSAPLDLVSLHHVVATYNGAVMSVWLDGVKRANAADSTVAPDTGTLMLGCRRTPTGVTACVDDGVLDEVAIYDHALVDTRIQAHYALGKP